MSHRTWNIKTGQETDVWKVLAFLTPLGRAALGEALTTR